MRAACAQAALFRCVSLRQAADRGDRTVSLGLRCASGGGLRALIAGAALIALVQRRSAKLKVTVNQRHHIVQGTTAVGLERSDERQSRARRSRQCLCLDPSQLQPVGLHAASAAAAARQTSRSGWSFHADAAEGRQHRRNEQPDAVGVERFAAFAKRHQARHQSSYTGCARAFVAKAERMSGKQCLPSRAISERRSTG